MDQPPYSPDPLLRSAPYIPQNPSGAQTGLGPSQLPDFGAPGLTSSASPGLGHATHPNASNQPSIQSAPAKGHQGTAYGPAATFGQQPRQTRSINAPPAAPSAPASSYKWNEGLGEEENRWEAAVHDYLESLATLDVSRQPRPVPPLSLDHFPGPPKGSKRIPENADEFYQLETWMEGEMPILRRRETGVVNGTKMLRLLGTLMTKGVRDNVLRSNPLREAYTPQALVDQGMSRGDASKNVPRKYQGVWIPLASARALALKHGLLPYLHTLLSSNPDAFLPASLQPRSPSPAGSNASSTGLVDIDQEGSEDEMTRWRSEEPLRGSLAEKPWGWVKMGREMVQQKIGIKVAARGY